MRQRESVRGSRPKYIIIMVVAAFNLNTLRWMKNEREPTHSSYYIKHSLTHAPDVVILLPPAVVSNNLNLSYKMRSLSTFLGFYLFLECRWRVYIRTHVMGMISFLQSASSAFLVLCIFKRIPCAYVIVILDYSYQSL